MAKKSDSDKSIRIFLGTPLSGAAKGSLEVLYGQRERLNDLWGCKVSWVRPESYHLTWLFMGNVPERKLESIIRRTSKVVEGGGSMNLPLKDLLFWPDDNRPKLFVWQGEDNEANLQPLYSALCKAFPGYADSRPFRPHITIARVRERNRNNASGEKIKELPIPEDLILAPQSWQITTVHLYQSILDPKGAIYRSLAEWPLN